MQCNWYEQDCTPSYTYVEIRSKVSSCINYKFTPPSRSYFERYYSYDKFYLVNINMLWNISTQSRIIQLYFLVWLLGYTFLFDLMWFFYQSFDNVMDAGWWWFFKDSMVFTNTAIQKAIWWTIACSDAFNWLCLTRKRSMARGKGFICGLICLIRH